MTSMLRRGLRRIVDALQRGLFDAPVAPAPAPAPPVADGAWSHPQATREAMLDGRRLAFRLVRVRRRSIGFVVDADGLSVGGASCISISATDARCTRSGAGSSPASPSSASAARAVAAARRRRDGATIDYRRAARDRPRSGPRSAPSARR
jgi:hypothetical protein